MSADYAVLDLDEVDQKPFPGSGINHRKLTTALGCTDVRVNTVTLDPGESTAPHAHERQEEVYIAIDGGQVRIDGDDHQIGPGGVVRIGPDPVRSVRNERADGSQTWVMVGAPPVGTVDDYGEYTRPDG